MTLLRVLIPAVYPQVPRSRGVGFLYKFFERSADPQVESIIDSSANIFDTSYKADALQNNRLKNDLSLSVPFMTSYAVALRSECRDKPFTDPSIRYVIIFLGKQTSFFIYLATYHPHQFLHTDV